MNFQGVVSPLNLLSCLIFLATQVHLGKAKKSKKTVLPSSQNGF